MIQAYSGEFTISPIALEMSMNYCSHKCAYCFANLNQPGRTLDANKTVLQIRNCNTQKSLHAFMLSNGYPVLLSNRVDPFAKTNYRQTLSFTEMLLQNGNLIAWQTKGGEGIDEVLSIIPHSNFYISISFIDDKLRKKIEPGAPSIESRFELIEKLISKGHHVSVGVNPLVEEWLPTFEAEQLSERLIALGIKNIWVESLHLNGNQIKQMTSKEKDAIGKENIELAKRKGSGFSYFKSIHDLFSENFDVFSMNQPIKSTFFESYHKKYKSLKTHQDFINYCFEKYPNGGEIKWHEYYQFMSNGNENLFNYISGDADGYVFRIARNIHKERVTERIRTLKGVLAAYWENKEIAKSLANNGLFSIMCYEEKDILYPWRCNEDNMMVYYFHGYNANSWYHIVNN